MAVQTQIQTRRGTAATWTSTNPTLAAGEIGFETDTNKFKIGTGSTAWTALAYAANLSPLTTKGDLYTYSTTNDRLPVGANGETIVADSSTSTGLRYTAGTVQANPVLNSAMQIWQRGTSMAGSTTAFSADRWQSYRAVAGSTFSRQVTNDTTNLPNIQYCARVSRDSGNTSTSAIAFFQNFETINSIPFTGKSVTVSFYARSGANYSPTSSGLVVQLVSGTGTDQNVITGYTSPTNVVNQTATLTTTWQRFTYTGTVGTSATELAMYFQSNPTGTAGANDYFEVTGVQIDIGSVALPFRTYAGTIQGELLACRRYLPAITLSGGLNTFNGYAYTTNGGLFVVPFDTPARVPATGITIPTVSGNFTVRNSTNADAGATTMTFDTAGLYNASVLTNGILTAGTVARLVSNQGAGYILFTGCEL